MDLNNVEAGDPFGYVDTRLVDSDTGTRFLDKVALATDIPRGAATCTITSRQSADKPGDPPIAHVQTIPAGNVYVAYAAFTGFRCDRAVGDHDLAVDQLRRDLERADRAEHGVAAGAEPADRRQPDRRRGLRLVAAVQVPDAGRRRDGREVDQRRRDVQQAAARLRASVRSIRAPRRRSFRSNGFQTMAVDATGRVYLAWPDRGYATRAQRSCHRRLAHRHLDVDDGLDVDRAARDPARRASAIS